MSLRFRLNLMIALTLGAIVGVGGLLALHGARRSVEEEIQSSLRLALQLVDAELTDGGSAASGRWLARVGRLESSRRLRIEVEQGGRLLHQGPNQDAPTGEAAPAWFRWAVAPPPLRAERQLTLPDGAAVRVLIEADPRDEMVEAWRETRGFFLLLAALAAAVLALVYVTLGRAFAAVGRILDGLQHMEAGNYAERLPAFPVAEFARIAAAFNHAAESLDKTRVENRTLTRRLLGLQEEERRAIARELHDEMGQSLSAMKALAVSLRGATAGPQVRGIADALVSLCDHLFPVVRGMMQRLRPPMLEELGLKASLEDLLDGWRGRCPDSRWHLECDEAVDTLPDAVQINLFRIVQEALSNVVKHAGAPSVAVELRVEPGRIALAVADDGAGFTPGQAAPGLGIGGMRERVHGLGGTFSIDSAPQKGTRLLANIPLC